MFAQQRNSELRVLIVAEHASFKFGGEASLPLHYFRYLRARGVECWMVLHERTRGELEELLGQEIRRITFIPDTRWQVLLWKAGHLLPQRLQVFTSGWAIRLITQRRQRKEARRLVRDLRVNVVHEPIPVSPRMPSMLHDVGAPVIFGPMNGDMGFPPGFPHLDRKREKVLIRLARKLAGPMNRLSPGKRKAALLLVANERTRRALPPGLCRNVKVMVENGVDLPLWRLPRSHRSTEGPIVFGYMGRLVALKACNLMLRAFADVLAEHSARLILMGDGPERPRLERLAADLGIAEHVQFHGWLSQQNCAIALAGCDALILPSLHECGGAVVLEGMAAGLPVIAADWGGPADYIDPSCGILIPPKDPESYVDGLAEAMLRLARSPELRAQMGHAARAKVEQEFCWERRIDSMIDLYNDVAFGAAPAPRSVHLDLGEIPSETQAAAR
jgi:glycosyltransferase involved in cell wall biosynthesis